MFADVFRNRRVLLTGHTGFKGSWLMLWLQQLGAEVSGLALDPETSPSHWDQLKLDMPDHRVDIRDAAAVARVVKEARPEIVFHLAAQALVRRSYRIPQETWDTNVNGTVNVLESCRTAPDIKAIVVVTTDKCYENKESATGYTEEDTLGGHDPYSASKAAAELVVASYRDALFKGSPLIASARAGNVIGGGDWSEDRLIPDLMRAQQRGEALTVRAPDAMRPWQHVLEPLAGYLQLGQGLLTGKKEFEGAWNFGPEDGAALKVSEVLRRMNADWKAVPDNTLHETTLLQLDSTKARTKLKWHPVWNMDEQLAMTSGWYKAFHEKKLVISPEQLDDYTQAAKKTKAAWA